MNNNGERIIEKGDFKVTIGGCSPGARGLDLGAAKPIAAIFTVK